VPKSLRRAPNVLWEDIRVRVLGLRGRHQNRFYLKDRMKITYMGQNIN
jgi:hypothetical protein